MKTLSIILISLIPVFIGFYKTQNYYIRAKTLNELAQKTALAKDTALLTKKSLSEIFYEIGFPLIDAKTLTLDEKKCESQNIKKEEKAIINSFLEAMKKGGSDFLKDECELYINRIEEIKKTVTGEVKKQQKVTLTLAFSLSATIVLLLI